MHPVAIRWQLGDELSKLSGKRHVIQSGLLALVDPIGGARQLDREIGARHTQDFTNRLRRSSPGSNGERNQFFCSAILHCFTEDF